jgi:3-hydroxyisobutyrate dehydrogenase-like beta-hydroxyacid dehydrogenase
MIFNINLNSILLIQPTLSDKKKLAHSPADVYNGKPGEIGIIGLGRVGIPAAKAYQKAGITVFGYARRPEIIKTFEDMGGVYLSSPAEVAKRCKLVLVMVLNDQQVIDVISGDKGLLKGAGIGSIIVCMSTINRKNLESVAESCKKMKVGFVDCPFTGGPARVPTASLTLIAAAPGQLIKAVTPILSIIGNVFHVGDAPGSGQAVKHCNQLLVSSTHSATMELITLARKLNLDPALVCKIVGSGIAGSDYFRLLSDSVLYGKPSPGGLGQMCKDVSIVSNTLDEVNMLAYVAKGAAKYFKLAEELGMQNREGADLIEVIEIVSERNKKS